MAVVRPMSRLITELLFIIAEEARARGEEVKRCRCYERLRAASFGSFFLLIPEQMQVESEKGHDSGGKR
jgi:hypothetical protein